MWKDIKGYEGLYQVSNLGRVKSLDRYVNGRIGKQFIYGRILINCSQVNGYKYVALCKDGNKKTFRIHRLVAQAFISNPYNKLEVNHKDEDIINNLVGNLEWSTPKENANYGTRVKRCSKPQQIKVVKLDDELNLIKIYDSCASAGEENNVDSASIIRVCKGRQLHSMGFKWMYYKDYASL